MHLYLKKKNVVLAVLLLFGGFYFLSLFAGGLSSHKEPAPLDFSLDSERLVLTDSWVDQDYLPLNVSYRLLAGAPSTQQRYLSIGISSVKRTRGRYLIPTLKSVFSQSSEEERSSMVVVVLLADFDTNWRLSTVTEIRTAFPSELEQGQLVVLHVPQAWYPPLTGLKRNYNDAPERVSFRSKQNVDYSFLMHYSAGLGRYYLQLEDDIAAAKHFLTTIKKGVEVQEASRITWAMLEFSNLGYIGKLYKSSHLPLLARFLFLFYQEMPCDWLMSHFRVLLTQKDPIILKPTLFQHMGTFSSFQGTYNSLKDKDFEDLYANPPAEVYSDMTTHENHLPKHSWDEGAGFFWGLRPKKGNYLTVVFKDPAVVTELMVETGTGGKDLLESAQMEIGHDAVTTDKGEKSCKEFQTVGIFENGMFRMLKMDENYSSPSSCLRIEVTADQEQWLIIQKIRISTKPSKPLGGA